MAIVNNGQYFTVKTDLDTQKGAVLVEGGQGTTVVSCLVPVVLRATLGFLALEVGGGVV